MNETTTPETPPCNRCADCAERGGQLMALAREHKVVDGDNESDTQILDAIIHLHHLYDTLPQAERNYASWEDLIHSTGTHYDAEVEGEDCGWECERHGTRFNPATAGWLLWPFPEGTDTEHLDWIQLNLGSTTYEWLTENDHIWIRRLAD